MVIVSFELTMPNVGSWNGKWSGANKKYYIVKSFSDKWVKNQEPFKDLLKDNHDSWYYSWGDGWGASVRAEIIDSVEAKRRRKDSKGFCGYDWMVESIVNYGKISTETERKNQTVTA